MGNQERILNRKTDLLGGFFLFTFDYLIRQKKYERFYNRAVQGTY